MKPKVDSYVEAKKVTRVDNVCRNGVCAVGREEDGLVCTDAWEGSRSWQCVLLVRIAVCVTFMGIIVFLMSTLKTIWAASAE